MPRIALASAKESFGFGGLEMRSPDGETGEVERVSEKMAVLVVDGDLVVFVLVRFGAGGRGGVSEAIFKARRYR